MKKFTVNPNFDCNEGKLYKLAFRTGAHKSKKKDAKRDRKNWKKKLDT